MPLPYMNTQQDVGAQDPMHLTRPHFPAQGPELSTRALKEAKTQGQESRQPGAGRVLDQNVGFVSPFGPVVSFSPSLTHYVPNSKKTQSPMHSHMAVALHRGIRSLVSGCHNGTGWHQSTSTASCREFHCPPWP